MNWSTWLGARTARTGIRFLTDCSDTAAGNIGPMKDSIDLKSRQIMMTIAVLRRGKRMNKDINGTLAALIPVLKMNGEDVVSIEAVHDWYKGQYKDSDGRHREYMKEVAEITYASGHVKYADIDCDSNLTACYDVLAVIQQFKSESAVIERIERGVYPSADMRGGQDGTRD